MDSEGTNVKTDLLNAAEKRNGIFKSGFSGGKVIFNYHNISMTLRASGGKSNKNAVLIANFNEKSDKKIDLQNRISNNHKKNMTSNDPEFDKKFFAGANDPAFSVDFFNSDVRKKFVNLDIPRLDYHATFWFMYNGKRLKAVSQFYKSQKNLDALVEGAFVFIDRLREMRIIN